MKTPMSRMRDSFDNLKALLPDGFNEYNLNKAEPRYVSAEYREEARSSYTKGVKNDFIRIFKNVNSGMSFAFAFNNFKDQIENTRVSLSVKNDKGKIMVTKEMNLAEAKSGLNALNKELKNVKNKNYKSFFKCLSEVFELDDIKIPNSFTSELTKLSDKLSKDEQEYAVLESDYKKICQKRDNEKKRIDNLVAAYKKELETKANIQELNNAIAEKSDILKRFEKKTFKKVESFFVSNNIGMIKEKWRSSRQKNSRVYGSLLPKILDDNY